MTAGTFNDLQKRIDEWTHDMLSDPKKMQYWAESKSLDKLNASGLLLDKEIKKISAKVEKDKLLDELFGVK